MKGGTCRSCDPRDHQLDDVLDITIHECVVDVEPEAVDQRAPGGPKRLPRGGYARLGELLRATFGSTTTGSEHSIRPQGRTVSREQVIELSGDEQGGPRHDAAELELAMP
jgi:hypothetical protein